MSRNGRRRPPKPRIELITPTPSRGEAAAIAAAIERFVADTAPPPSPEPPRPSAWQRAALHEGVEGRSAFGSAWDRSAVGGWRPAPIPDRTLAPMFIDRGRRPWL